MPFAVGLMSGTSLDGVDAALVEINGKNESTTVELIHFITVPYGQDTLKKIRDALSIDNSNVKKICSLNFELAEIFSEAVKVVCEEAEFDIGDLSFIGSHGQTLFHIPELDGEYHASTLQIGDPSVIAERTKTTVVSNFRERDMSVRGQGAPIVPFSEYILYKSKQTTRLLQNIGGIGNITVIPKDGSLNDVLAFDTGPGNVIINELCLHFYQKEFDDKGRIAKSGNVDQSILSAMMSHPFVKKKYPKTTGREEFGKEYVAELLMHWDASPEDWVATATMFTAKTIAASVEPFVSNPTELIISGGGSYNLTLIDYIKTELPDLQVLTQEEIGKSSEAKEAIAMTILANQTLNHETSNVKSATGATKNVLLGSITYYE